MSLRHRTVLNFGKLGFRIGTGEFQIWGRRVSETDDFQMRDSFGYWTVRFEIWDKWVSDLGQFWILENWVLELGQVSFRLGTGEFEIWDS